MESKNKNISIVIHITESAESARFAVKSIINNIDLIHSVHFIHPAYDTDKTSMYKGWTEDRISLAGTPIYFHPEMRSSDFESSIVCEIPPFCELKKGPLKTIEKRLRHSSHSQNHCILSTVSIYEGFSVFYGFLLVLQVIDWIWNRVFENNKLIQYTDVIARQVIRKGQKKFLPTERFSWRLWNSEVIPKIYCKESALKFGSMSSYETLKWRLYTHKNLTFGLWIFLYFPIYITTALPWVSMTFFGANVLVQIVVLLWIIEFILTWLVCKDYVKMRAVFVYAALFPVYWVFFPFFLIWSKLSVPKKGW